MCLRTDFSKLYKDWDRPGYCDRTSGPDPTYRYLQTPYVRQMSNNHSLYAPPPTPTVKGPGTVTEKSVPGSQNNIDSPATELSTIIDEAAQDEWEIVVQEL